MTRTQVASARKEKVAPITARPKTHLVQVSSPTVPGAVEHIEKNINTIEHLHKRKHIDSHCYHAAEKMRHAFETIYGQAGGGMNFDKAGGPGVPGQPPLPSCMAAAETLNFAKRVLYPLDHRVVFVVACEGETIENTAGIIFGNPPTRSEKEQVGNRLREGLRQLADHWYGGSTNGSAERRDSIYHAPDVHPKAKPYTVGGVAVERGKTVHATGRKVFDNR